MRRDVTCLLAAAAAAAVAVAGAASRAHAQAHDAACRRTCRADETRDANGCCVAPGPARPDAVRPLPRRCPAGTTWSDAQRACMGRLQCPAGSHPEEGRGCVADAVGCPAGSRPEEGRCVADVTCPPGARLEHGACVSDVACPPGARLEGGRCVSADVRCPAGTRPREGGGCVGDPTCPAGAHYVEGRGCVGDAACAPGSHLAGGACVPDVVCLEGTRFVEGRGCVDACERFPHARWASDRGACTCEAGYTVQDGRCVAQSECPPGTHPERGACVPEVICPYGYRFVRGSGCVDPALAGDDPALAAAAARDPAEARRVEAARRARDEERRRARWGEGPGLHAWAGGGFVALFVPQVFRAVAGSQETGGARWLDAAVSAGLTYVANEIAAGLTYTYFGPGPATTDTPWRIVPEPMHVVAAEVGQQGAGPVHAWRVTLGGGYDLGGNGIVAHAAYRSTFRLVAGLFVGLELRGMGVFRIGEFQGTWCYERAPGVCTQVGVASLANTPGGGGLGMVFLGYSLH